MPQFQPITDAYIDEVIKSAGPYNPLLLKTQGVKLRELIKLLRDRLDHGNSFIEQYDSQRIYSLGEVVYIEVENGSSVPALDPSLASISTTRLLYQSTSDNNQGTFGGVSYIANTENNPIPPQNLVTGLIFPFTALGLVYDDNLEIVLAGYDPNIPASYEAVRVKLKKDDGRVVGFYADYNQQNPVTPTHSMLTVIFRVSEDSLENTEVLIDKGVVSAYTHVFFMTKEGVAVKVTPDVSQDTQLIDMTLIAPSLWKLIGYPQSKSLDTSKFLTTSGTSQIKSGGLQITNEFSNLGVRKLFETVPYNQRDTINGYLEEKVGQTTQLTNVLNKYVVLGYFFSEGYFQNSFEITIIAYDGAVSKKYNVLQSYLGNGGNYIGTNSVSGWFELIAQTDGGSRGVNSLVLEAKYKYPYGWFIRAKIKAADADQSPESGRNFGYYIKSIQGGFRIYGETENLDDIGPKTGIDEVPVTMSYGPTQIAQRLKLGLPDISESNFAYLTWDNITGEVKQTTQNLGEGDGLTAVTYTQLVTLITTSALVPGKKYLLTDYRTAWRIDFTTRYANDVEPLILTAASVNKLHSSAISTIYTKDQVYYSFGTIDYTGNENPYKEEEWSYVSDGVTPEKGMIYRRIDTTKHNDINFDFRGFWVDYNGNQYSMAASLGRNVKIINSSMDTFYNRVPLIGGYLNLDNCTLTMTYQGSTDSGQLLPVTFNDLTFSVFNSNVRAENFYRWSLSSQVGVVIENCGNVNIQSVTANSPSLKNIVFMEIHDYPPFVFSANVKAILANDNTKLSVRSKQVSNYSIEIVQLVGGVLTYTNEPIT